MNQSIKSAMLVVAMFLPGTVAAGSAAAVQVGCTPEARSAVKDVLDAAQLACIVATQFTDQEEVMEACAIERRLSPLVEPLLAQKKAAKRAAACAPDAGSSDAGKDAK